VVVSADPTAVAAQLRQACDAGQQQGCVGLAMLYWRGMGVAEDKDQAQALLQKACDSGEALGCAMRDRLLHAGEAPGASPVGAVAIDPQTVSTLEAACTSGNQDACVGVGTLYWRGMGVAEDHEKARALLDHACQSGNANGCTALRLLTAKP
jgi:TPR repeat protein